MSDIGVRMNDHDLLTQIEGIGPTRANNLLDKFGSGSAVAKRASNGWGKIAEVDGFTKESAKNLFHKMQDAKVYDELRGR